MGIVTSKEIAKVIGVEKFGVAGTFIGWTLMKVLRISAINNLYNNFCINYINYYFHII